MTYEETKDYMISRKDELKLHYPYAMIVREKDSAILFVNREDVALSPSFVLVPAQIVSQIAELGDTNGPTSVGFKTYWFYNYKNAPYDHIDEQEMYDYREKMNKIGSLLFKYKFSSDMYFDFPTTVKHNYIHFD